MSGGIQYSNNTDADTGNRPDDHDYDFCHRMGIPTIESQRRRSIVSQPYVERNEWFKHSSAFTGD